MRVRRSDDQTPSSDVIIVGPWGNWVNGSWILDNLGCFHDREDGMPYSPVVVTAVGHNYRGNCGYADGHVKWLPNQRIAYNYATETTCSNNNGGTVRRFGKCASALHE